MKKIILLFALVLSTSTKANPCDSIPPQFQISYTQGDHTFCVMPPKIAPWVWCIAENIDTATCYFVVNGTPSVSMYVMFSPLTAGITTFSLIGVNPAYPACTQTISWSFTTVACQSVGIEEYEAYEAIKPVYYDLMGNVIDIIYNEMIIERRGKYAKKVIFQK